MGNKTKFAVLLMFAALVLPALVEAAGVVNDSGGNWTVFDYGAGEVNDSGGNWTVRGVYGAGEVNDSGGNWTVLGVGLFDRVMLVAPPAAPPLAGEPVPAAGGGAGGGAGGTFTSKAIELIKEIIANTPTNIKNTNPNIKLDSLSFVLDEDAKDVNVQIELLRNEPNLQGPTGQFYLAGTPIVYQYLRITLGGQESKLKEATIDFHVEKSWIEQYNINTNTIHLAHLKDNSWEPLPTNKLSEDSDNIYFSAPTDSFSIFAIVGDSELGLPNIDLSFLEADRYCGNLICEPNELPGVCPADCAETYPLASRQTAYNFFTIFATANVIILLLIFLFARKPGHSEMVKNYMAVSMRAGYKPKSALENYVYGALKAGHSSDKVLAQLLNVGWEEKAIKKLINQIKKKV